MDVAKHSVQWPDNARAAMAITLDNMGEAADLNRGLWPKSEAVGSHFSVTKVLPQMLAILAKYDIRVTYFIESWNLKRYPHMIQQISDAHHEIGWHAWSHEAWSKLDENDENDNFERSFGMEGIGAFQGQLSSYKGFRPPGGTIHGQRTLALCKKHDLRYVSPAAHDAAVVPVGADSIVILPFRWTTVDAYFYMEEFGGLRKAKGQDEDPQTEEQLVKSMKAQINDNIEKGGYLSVLFHPFLTADSFRQHAFESVVKHIAELRDNGEIWLARCQDIQEWLSEHSNTVGNDPGWDETSWR